MSKFVERAGWSTMAFLLAYAIYNVSTLSIGAVAPPTPTETIAPTVEQSQPATAPVVADAGSTLPDPKAGEKLFAKCKSCHSIEISKNAVGPSLYGIVNGPAGKAVGFKYSAAMAATGENWSAQRLDQFLKDPKATVPGTKMSFAGLPKAEDRANIIAFLAQKSDTPIAPAELGFGVAAAAAQGVPQAAPAAEASAVSYTDPPAPGPEALAREAEAVSALKASLAGLDYQRARYHPIHFKPRVDTASDGECLACHREILETPVRAVSPAGVEAKHSLAWYQTLATYSGPQMNFHQRHLTSPFAQAVMNLKCTFCHQGNDPREESPVFTATAADLASNNGGEPFTNRKMVNPSETCLRCHGALPDPVNIMGLSGPWEEARKDLETAETPNGCLTCHTELFRTNRHKVTYLNAATIEDLATESSDVCFGCHGGRAWYMKSYPYPRHPWPGMDPAVPEWAKGRSSESDPRYIIKDAAQ